MDKHPPGKLLPLHRLLQAVSTDFNCSCVTNAACEAIRSFTRDSVACSRSGSTGLVR